MPSPLAVNPSKDTLFYHGGVTLNGGNYTPLYSGVNGGAGTNEFRSTIGFDTSSIPAGSTVTSATLALTVAAVTTGGTVNVYRMIQSWVEGTGTFSASGDGATWNTYNGSSNWATAGMGSGTDRSSTLMGTLAISSTGTKTINLDATEVGLMLATTPSGLCVIENTATANWWVSYNSKEAASNKPLLTINYTTSAGTAKFLTLLGVG